MRDILLVLLLVILAAVIAHYPIVLDKPVKFVDVTI